MRRFLAKLGLLLAGTLVALLLAEGVVRLVAPHSRDHVLPSGSFVMDDLLGWRLGGERTRRHRTRYFDVLYTSNRAGFRDRERTAEKQPEVRRVLVFGDSLVFGWGVVEESRFTNLLEQRLTRSEVWNLAVPGYGLDQEIVSYESLDQDLSVDLVILYVSRSTLSRSTSGKIYSKYKPRFELGEGSLRQVPIPAGGNARTSMLYRALSPFYLPYFVQRRLAEFRRRGRDRTEGRPLTHVLSDLDEALMWHAVEVARGRGHQPAILADLAPPGRTELRRLCASWGVLFLEIDLSGQVDAVFGPHDSHWTEAAHDEVARQLQAQLDVRWPEVTR